MNYGDVNFIVEYYETLQNTAEYTYMHNMQINSERKI